MDIYGSKKWDTDDLSQKVQKRTVRNILNFFKPPISSLKHCRFMFWFQKNSLDLASFRLSFRKMQLVQCLLEKSFLICQNWNCFIRHCTLHSLKLIVIKRGIRFLFSLQNFYKETLDCRNSKNKYFYCYTWNGVRLEVFTYAMVY